MDALFPPKMDMLEVLIHSIPLGQQLWFLVKPGRWHMDPYLMIVSINIYNYISYYLIYIYTTYKSCSMPHWNLGWLYIDTLIRFPYLA